MSKMELPSDIAEKVVGMLNTKDIPRAVLAYNGLYFYIRSDACTSEELMALGFDAAPGILAVKSLRYTDEINAVVARALALGFEFPTDYDKSKYAKRELFVMHKAPAPREFA